MEQGMDVPRRLPTAWKPADDDLLPGRALDVLAGRDDEPDLVLTAPPFDLAAAEGADPTEGGADPEPVDAGELERTFWGSPSHR